MHSRIMMAIVSSIYVGLDGTLSYEEAHIDKRIVNRTNVNSKIIAFNKEQQTQFNEIVNDRLTVTERAYALFDAYLASRINLGVSEEDIWKELCAIIYGRSRRPAWSTGDNYMVYTRALYWSLPSPRRTEVKSALTNKLYAKKIRNKGVMNASC